MSCCSGLFVSRRDLSQVRLSRCTENVDFGMAHRFIALKSWTDWDVWASKSVLPHFCCSRDRPKSGDLSHNRDVTDPAPVSDSEVVGLGARRSQVIQFMALRHTTRPGCNEIEEEP
jgi:hypothetical protein